MQNEIKFGVIHRETAAFMAINLPDLTAARKKAKSLAQHNAAPRTAFIAVKYFD